MATTFLNERLMRAADALIAQNEVVEVIYRGAGEQRRCMVIGRGEAAGTVRLAIWVRANEVRNGKRPVVFTDCLVPAETQVRLEQIAREQETVSRFDPVSGRRYTTLTAEVARALEFAATARAQRTRDGRYADCTHRAEPAGVR